MQTKQNKRSIYAVSDKIIKRLAKEGKRSYLKRILPLLSCYRKNDFFNELTNEQLYLLIKHNFFKTINPHLLEFKVFTEKVISIIKNIQRLEQVLIFFNQNKTNLSKVTEALITFNNANNQKILTDENIKMLFNSKAGLIYLLNLTKNFIAQKKEVKQKIKKDNENFECKEYFKYFDFKEFYPILKVIKNKLKGVQNV